MDLILENMHYYLGGEVNSKKILDKKRRKRAKEASDSNASKIVPAVAIAAATTVTVAVFYPAVMEKVPFQNNIVQVEENFVPQIDLLNEVQPNVSEKTLQEQLDDFVFYARMRTIERNLEAQKLMEKAVKAQRAEKIRAESFFSTMQEMTIESRLSVKLTRISDNLDKLSELVENPAEAKKLETKIASQMEKLKQDLKEYPKQFEGLKLSLRSEKKRLKDYIVARKSYEEALRQARIQAQRELESLKSFYASFTCYSYVTPNMGISKERFREIMASIPYGSSTVFRNNADFMWELAKKGNFNEILLPGICAWESGWGDDAVESNNFSSQRKQDGSYFSYDTQEKGILALASNLADNYLPEDGIYYNGKCLDGINVLYCYPDPNHEWAKGVSACMKMVIREYLATIE